MKQQLQDIILNQFPYLSLEQIAILIKSLSNICYARNTNIQNLKVIGYGESSIVFELNNEIIKLTFNEYDNHPSMKEYVSHSSSILQPDFELIIDDVKMYGYNAKIIGLKKLFLEGITNEDVLNMYVQLRNDGYLWYDTKKENIGRDENGNLYLIDYGELIYINDLDFYRKKKELDAHKKLKSDLDEFYLSNKEFEQEDKNDNKGGEICK